MGSHEEGSINLHYCHYNIRENHNYLFKSSTLENGMEPSRMYKHAKIQPYYQTNNAWSRWRRIIFCAGIKGLFPNCEILGKPDTGKVSLIQFHREWNYLKLNTEMKYILQDTNCRTFFKFAEGMMFFTKTFMDSQEQKGRWLAKVNFRKVIFLKSYEFPDYLNLFFQNLV